METPYVPEIWKNLRLEIDDNKITNNSKIYKPRIIRTDSILKNKKESIKNKKDVFKEKHKKCDCDEDCYNLKYKLNFKCVIL